jgi:hypothetical protein
MRVWREDSLEHNYLPRHSTRQQMLIEEGFSPSRRISKQFVALLLCREDVSNDYDVYRLCDCHVSIHLEYLESNGHLGLYYIESVQR